MQALIIDEENKKKIAEILAYSAMNPYFLDELHQVNEKKLPPPGDSDNHALYLPNGFKVVFTISEHPRGFMRQMSVSINRKDKLPPVYFVEALMLLYKFKNPLSDCYIYFEDIKPGYRAVNVLEPWSDD